jgi:transposase InsO family protein
MCKVLEIPRSSYYKRKSHPVSNRTKENEALKREIKKIHLASKERYGSPRITAELHRAGLQCNKKRVARLMREQGISAKMFRKYKVTTNSDHTKPRSENILGGRFVAERPNQVWASDITYIKTAEGWLYLAAVLDIYSRKIVGWQVDKRLHSELVEEALRNALRDRSVSKGTIFHSDQGIQYVSESFGNLLAENGFRQSMSRRGNCYDNAITESFFHTLKTELTKNLKYKSRQEARVSLFEYIELFYNRKRLHSSLGYRSPVEYEKLTSLT